MSSSYSLPDLAKVALKGQTVLITGGTGGIGGAISRLFHQSGCNIIVTATTQDKADVLLKELGDSGEGKVWTYVCDIQNKDEVANVIAKTVTECPPIDILINNAGFALSATVPFWEQDLKDVDTVLGVNLQGLMYITHAVLKDHMMKRTPQPKGTIVNISSITGHQAPPKSANEASYHTSKAAVEGFTNVLRHETLGTNIRVLLNRPGTTFTEFHARRHKYNQENTDGSYRGLHPLEAQDIAEGVLWQCLQPERISVVLMEVLPTSQRSLYEADRQWEERNKDNAASGRS